MTQTGMGNGGNTESAARDKVYRLGEYDLVVVAFKWGGKRELKFNTPEEAHKVETVHSSRDDDEISIYRLTPGGGRHCCLRTRPPQPVFVEVGLQVFVENRYWVRHLWAMMGTLKACGWEEKYAEKAVRHLWRECEDIC